jgi:hypothetical protein
LMEIDMVDYLFYRLNKTSWMTLHPHAFGFAIRTTASRGHPQHAI